MDFYKDKSLDSFHESSSTYRKSIDGLSPPSESMSNIQKHFVDH